MLWARIVIIVALVLSAGVLAFALLGDWDLPFHIGGDEALIVGRLDASDLRKVRSTCRFGGALAGTQDLDEARPEELARAYANGLEGIDAEERQAIRDACLRGIRQAIRERAGS
jgi:hypothetical protein